MRWWPTRWRRRRLDEPENAPREAWLELPTGDKMRMVPVYRGTDDDGNHLWELFLEAPGSITLPLNGFKIEIDQIPGRSAVLLALQEVDDGNVKVFSRKGFRNGLGRR